MAEGPAPPLGGDGAAPQPVKAMKANVVAAAHNRNLTPRTVRDAAKSPTVRRLLFEPVPYGGISRRVSRDNSRYPALAGRLEDPHPRSAARLAMPQGVPDPIMLTVMAAYRQRLDRRTTSAHPCWLLPVALNPKRQRGSREVRFTAAKLTRYGDQTST